MPVPHGRGGDVYMAKALAGQTAKFVVRATTL